MPRDIQVDVRLRKDCNIDVLGHPILIVKIHNNGLVNFVILMNKCTTFRDRRPEDVFRHKPEKLREFIEIDSIPGNQLRKSEMRIGKAPAIPKGLLAFADGRRMPRRGYAGSMVYTISAKCLTSLNLRGLQDLPGCCMKICNVDLLIERIAMVGDIPETEYSISKFPISANVTFPSRETGQGSWAPGPWNDPEGIEDEVGWMW
ncbi:hypothetical protein DL95DRAFT_415730 [Leptodontidium sp. 2 PMI_412]|nr:hypothetical protein DL95DRAFT_415730 [Leptodontidium sp. 2 PMI_412]